MEYERKKLVAKENQIYAEDGEFICSVSMTRKHMYLLNDEEWDKVNESWLCYRERTKQAYKNEELKRIKFVEELVNSYNSSLA